VVPKSYAFALQILLVLHDRYVDCVEVESGHCKLVISFRGFNGFLMCNYTYSINSMD
jgi:hypothetical protein